MPIDKVSNERPQPVQPQRDRRAEARAAQEKEQAAQAAENKPQEERVENSDRRVDVEA